MELISTIDMGETNSSEHRDCTVRALANASMMEYSDAHALLKRHGRKNRIGATARMFVNAYAEAGFGKMTVFGTTKLAKHLDFNFESRISSVEKGITLKNFCKKYNKGRYIVVYSGHALAVVNGQIIDTFDSLANKRIAIAFSQS